MDSISSNDNWRNRQLMHTLTRAAPQELCLGHVQLQAFFTHPFSYILHTGCNLLTETRSLVWTTETIHLCVVSIKMSK